MKTAAEMTEKQRRAVEAMERAHNEGMSLSDYAKAHGLVIRELYDAIAGLRRANRSESRRPTRETGDRTAVSAAAAERLRVTQERG